MKTAPRTHITGAMVALVLVFSITAAQAIFPFSKRDDKELEESTPTPVSPGGMTITPQGEYIISAHQFFKGSLYKVMRQDRKTGQWLPFPNLEMNTGQSRLANLDAVLGLECDEDGVVWMLDNGRDGEKAVKIVAWDTKENQLKRVIELQQQALVGTSFVNDLALDPEEPFIYISDPASGDDAGIIVVDLRTGVSRRVLGGSFYVRPENIALEMEGKEVAAKKPDGSSEQAMRGVNPIAVDGKGRWLYFGAMNSQILYRVPTRQLRDARLSDKDLNVEQYSPKPICDSISIDSEGNIYFGDIQAGAISYSKADAPAGKKYQVLVDDPRIIWPDGLCFGTDGKLHFFSSQLNRSNVYNGKAAPLAPFQIFKIKAESEGVVGR